MVERGLPSSISHGFVQDYLYSVLGGGGRQREAFSRVRWATWPSSDLLCSVWASLVIAAGTARPARPVCHMGWK